MAMCYDDNWNNLPEELVIVILQSLSYFDDYLKFTAVCKSWRKSASDFQKPWLPPSSCPLLLLAEDGDESDDPDKDYENDNFDYKFDKVRNVYYFDRVDDDFYYLPRCHINNSVDTSRGLYSLSSMKTYTIELPEAVDKIILGTNKGWLLTIGRDKEINLLHPLLRHQIALPHMRTFPKQLTNIPPGDRYQMIILKVAISSQIQNKNTAFYHHPASPSPIVMVIYGKFHSTRFLGFARLGDKVWTHVEARSSSFNDIVHHKGNFYAVDSHGDVFVCDIDDDKERGGPRATKIASLKSDDNEQKYLVESLSGSSLLLLVRSRKMYFLLRGHETMWDVIDNEFIKLRGGAPMWVKNCTHDFSVWRLDLKYSDSLEILSYTLTEENNLGNEAIFVGRGSSISISSSETIKPNSIYFTDDDWKELLRKGRGGRDMGIFHMERRTIEPHFQGKSIHSVSPPLWFI